MATNFQSTLLTNFRLVPEGTDQPGAFISDAAQGVWAAGSENTLHSTSQNSLGKQSETKWASSASFRAPKVNLGNSIRLSAPSRMDRVRYPMNGFWIGACLLFFLAPMTGLCAGDVAALTSPQTIKFTHGSSVVIRPVSSDQHFDVVSIGTDSVVITDGKYEATVPISQILINGHSVVTPDIFAASQKAAAKGDAKAERDLGDDYYSGAGVTQDFSNAAKWYQKAADQGLADAESSLGQCYESGEGVDKNQTQACKWYLKAADQGEAWSEYKVGAAYASTMPDMGVPKDDAKAVEYLQKAADQGQVTADYVLGFTYLNGGLGLTPDLSKGVELLQKAADGGVPEAQYCLGYEFAAGTGLTKSPENAAIWYAKAADQGNVQAEIALAMALGTGQGVKYDQAAAGKWFAKAAASGDADAEDRLGLCYQQGFGVTQDDATALLWFAKSAQQGDADAELNLANCYAAGKGVQADPTAANGWYLKSAEKGTAAAEANLGNQYLKGIGTIKDELEGMAWIYAAAASGDQDVSAQITNLESTYTSDSIVAARKRAKEIQQEVAAQSFPDESPSTSNATPAPSSPSDSNNSSVKASGSGAFLTADGYILTAAHVVKGASRIVIVAADGKHSAKVVQVDENNDVALLKCDGTNFSPLPLQPSRTARLGQTVFTIGFPNIEVQGVSPKMTKGEISSLTVWMTMIVSGRLAPRFSLATRGGHFVTLMATSWDSSTRRSIRS